MAKERAVSFTVGEQQLIMEYYEDYKTIITKKGNTTIINKARDAAWESIAERINVSNPGGTIRTGAQIKIKHKNISSSANRKKADVQLTGGGPAPDPFTPAEELALSFNRGRPLMDGIDRIPSSEMVDPSLVGKLEALGCRPILFMGRAPRKGCRSSNWVATSLSDQSGDQLGDKPGDQLGNQLGDQPAAYNVMVKKKESHRERQKERRESESGVEWKDTWEHFDDDEGLFPP
ncbi:hypothetical protein AAFF_G00115760 [Aldrovandia affinis]|uniref:Myb/SANT-like DNA-binding domain-containing protein n=1 Tax=Aldrovandia affinis TaxID=143900 RepID=A0AAD7T1D8_9TELE|nr:hypothetical protein AAFF_G00115760 [Aldrovandia affinis]